MRSTLEHIGFFLVIIACRHVFATGNERYLLFSKQPEGAPHLAGRALIRPLGRLAGQAGRAGRLVLGSARHVLPARAGMLLVVVAALLLLVLLVLVLAVLLLLVLLVVVVLLVAVGGGRAPRRLQQVRAHLLQLVVRAHQHAAVRLQLLRARTSHTP